MPRHTGFLVLVAVCCVASSAVRAQTQEAMLVASNRITSDIMGWDVATDGQTVVSGAPFGSHSGFQQPGRAFVFERDENGAWSQRQTLVPSHLETNGWFGIAVAVDGDTIAIGAEGENAGMTDAGAVYIFERKQGAWQETGKLTTPDPNGNDRFGSSVSLNGDELVIGARGHTVNGNVAAGAVYTYLRNGNDWEFDQKLTASDGAGSDVFGISCDRDGDGLIIGASLVDVDGMADAGAAYVFRRVNDAWIEEGKLVASQAAAAVEFGNTVNIDGTTVVIGAANETYDNRDKAGAAYVFEHDGKSWSETARLTAPDGEGGDLFGIDADVEGDTLLVGAYLDTNEGGGGTGSVYIFDRSGDAWTYRTRFIPENAVPRLLFGWTIQMAAGRAVISAPFFELNRGAAYVFADLSGGGECRGKEAIRKAVCSRSGDKRKLAVTLVGGVDGDTWHIALSDGQTADGVLNRKGKAKAKFKNPPQGPGTADATFGCGATDRRIYDCP